MLQFTACVSVLQPLDPDCLGISRNAEGMHVTENVFSHVPSGKVREVAAPLKAIQAHEIRESALAKAVHVVNILRETKHWTGG